MLASQAAFPIPVVVVPGSLSDTEIDAKIKEKLSKFMGVIDITDITDIEENTLNEPKQPDDTDEG